MGWSDKSVSPVVYTPQLADAVNLTLDKGLILSAGNIYGPIAGSRSSLMVELIDPATNYTINPTTGIGTWADTSGNARHAVSIASGPPLDGQGISLFGGYFDVDLGTLVNQRDWSIFLAFKFKQQFLIQQPNFLVSMHETTPVRRWGIAVDSLTAGVKKGWAGAGGNVQLGAWASPFAVNESAIITVNKTTTWVFRKNGVVDGFASGDSTALNGASRLRIGAEINGNYYATVTLYAVVVFNRSLSAGEMQAWETWLGARL